MKKIINNLLDKDGFVLLEKNENNFRVSNFDRFTKNVLGPSVNYLGGTSPRQQIKPGIYEATRLPENYSILLHQEMSYLNQMPKFICFFLVTPGETGGCSLIGDMTFMDEILSKEVLNYFRNQKLRLKRVLFGEQSKYYLKNIHKSWQEVFLVNKKEKVEEIATKKGWKWRWMEHDALEILQDAHPISRYHHGLKKEVWCNQLHIFTIACQKLWAIKDNRKESFDSLTLCEKEHPEYLDQMVFDDGSSIDEDMAIQVFESIKKIEQTIFLDKGDLLILDNLRYSHGRQAFTGNRQLLVTMH